MFGVRVRAGGAASARRAGQDFAVWPPTRLIPAIKLRRRPASAVIARARQRPWHRERSDRFVPRVCPRAGCGAPRSDDAGVQMSWHSPRTEPGPRTKPTVAQAPVASGHREGADVAIQERPSATDRLARAVSGGCPIAAPRAASDAIRSPGVILVRMKLLQLQERAQSLPDERSEGVLRGRRVPSECCRKKIGRPVRRRHPERAYRRNRSTNGQGDKERSDEPIHKRARAAAGSPGRAPSGMFA